MSSYTVGIVGSGLSADTAMQFAGPHVEVRRCEIGSMTEDAKPSGIADVARCDIVLLTASNGIRTDGSSCTRAVEEIVELLKEAGASRIFVISTVPPGTCERIGVHFMPEFATTKNYATDFRACPEWLFGLRTPDDELRAYLLLFLKTCRDDGIIQSARAKFMSTTEAELVKYFRNCFLASKVAFCNEFSSICSACNVDYECVREVATADPRVGGSHTQVPGPDGAAGFGGPCLPHDMRALARVAAQSWVPCPVLEAVISRNKNIDRQATAP